MGNSVKPILLFCLLCLFFLIFPKKTSATVQVWYDGSSAPQTMASCPSSGTYYCRDLSTGTEICPNTTYTTDLSPCLNSGKNYSNTCCTSGGGCDTPSGSRINQWDYNYATFCKIDSLGGPGLGCNLSFTYDTQTCGATDTCQSTPYLYAGACNPACNGQTSCTGRSACTVGGLYKTCCNSDGTVDGACRGGQFTGTCPSGTTTVICGVSSCAGINAPCTTAACGAPACQTLCTRTPGSYAGSICSSCNWSTILRYNCDGSTYLAEGQSDSSCNTPEFCPSTDCNTDKVCGACTLTSSGNACSNNGTQACTYTGSNTGDPECNQVDAPPETCSIVNCSPDYSCPNGICIPDDGSGGCTSDGSCSAPAPACETTTSGTDNCGNFCSRTGPACTGGGCGKSCTYSQGGTCYSGNCLDGTQNCSTNVNCGYVSGCSTGAQVSCGSTCGDGTCEAGEGQTCPGDCPGGGSKYSCSSNSCVLDPNGNYTTANCDGSCACTGANCLCPPGGNCDGSPLCPVMHPFAQIRNLTKGENFPSSVTYKGVTYNLTSPGACASSGPNCGLAIESAAQSINADPGDVLEMRVMEANENERSGAIHSVEVRFWGDKGITAYPNGLADDEAGNGDFCTNQYFNGLTNFANAKIYCVGGGSMGCPWTYSSAIEDKKSEPGEPQAWGTGVVSTNWNTARYQVAADAVPGTKAGITAVTFPVSGIQTPSGQCFWQNNGSASDKDFRWKTDGKMCPFTNDMFYDSLPLTVQINGCSGYNTVDAPAEGTSYTLNNTYTFSGWSTFCFGPNGTNRNRVNPYICDQGTWNNCRYIGPTSSLWRQDIENAAWTCGNLNSNSDGWTFNFTPDSTYLGNKTLRVASINDQATSCLVWESKNINIAVSTVPISGYIRSFQTGEGIRGVQVAVTDNTLGGVTRSSRPSEASGFWQVDGLVRTGDSYAVRIPGEAPEGYILPPRTSTCDYSWNFDVNDQLPAVRPNPWADTRCWYSSSYEGQKAGSRDCAGADVAGVTGRCNFVYDRDSVIASPPPPIPTPNASPWIQTTTGDVHSNTKINTPGGP